MKTLLVSAAALAAIFATPAMAQSVSAPEYYGTLGYSQLDGSDGDLGAVTGRLGAKFTPYIGAEAEASFGVKDDDFTVGTERGSLKHEYDAAAYVVGTLPISPNFEIFGRAGYGTTEVKAELAGFEASEDGESFNYGAGANYFFDGQNGVRGDWTRRDFRDDGGEFDAYTVSYVRRF